MEQAGLAPMGEALRAIHRNPHEMVQEAGFSATDSAPGLRHFRAFGLHVASDLRFAALPESVCHEPDVVVAKTNTPELFDGLAGPAAAAGPVGTRRYRRLHFQEIALDALSVSGFGDFIVTPSRIEYRCFGGVDPQTLDRQILTYVLPFWLERQHILVLHASSVVIDGRAVLFMAYSGCGKSTVATAFRSAGFQMLGDDLAPLEQVADRFWVRSAYPLARMWPTAGRHFIPDIESQPKVNPLVAKRLIAIEDGAFCDESKPLAAIYVLARRNDLSEGEFQAVPPMQSVMELVRHTFAFRAVAAAGLQPARLRQFSKLLARVPVRRLDYPDGLGYLPGVCESVVRDVGLFGTD